MAIALPERAVAERPFELTTEQKTAVEWGDGPLMVLAGAGANHQPRSSVVRVQREETLWRANIDSIADGQRPEQV